MGSIDLRSDRVVLCSRAAQQHVERLGPTLGGAQHQRI